MFGKYSIAKAWVLEENCHRLPRCHNVIDGHIDGAGEFMSLQLPSWVQELFETDEDVLFFLDRDLRIADCNVGWDKFAIANGGVGISREEIRGRNIYELIPEVLVQFYRDKYSEALRTRLWIGFDYECSTPEVPRLYHMALRSIESSGLLVVNSRLTSQRAPLDHSGEVLADEAYISPGGFITMCAHCRRTRRQYSPDAWDWVPRFLRDAGRKVSHGLCPRCKSYLYPDLQ